MLVAHSNHTASRQEPREAIYRVTLSFGDYNNRHRFMQMTRNFESRILPNLYEYLRGWRNSNLYFRFGIVPTLEALEFYTLFVIQSGLISVAHPYIGTIGSLPLRVADELRETEIGGSIMHNEDFERMRFNDNSTALIREHLTRRYNGRYIPNTIDLLKTLMEVESTFKSNYVRHKKKTVNDYMNSSSLQEFPMHFQNAQLEEVINA